MPSSPSRTSPPADPALERVLEQVDQLEAELAQVREALTRSHRLATLGTISSIIAHEYHNILTPIVTYAQLALAHPEDVELLRKALGKSLAGAQRAASISSSLLGFAGDRHSGSTANLRQVVDETLACLGRDLSKDGIALTLALPEVDVAMEPVKLQQVMLNLILNARKAMREPTRGAGGLSGGGRLTVRGEVAGEWVVVEVADTGPGIPEAIADRLFEPFVTAEVGRDQEEETRRQGDKETRLAAKRPRSGAREEGVESSDIRHQTSDIRHSDGVQSSKVKGQSSKSEVQSSTCKVQSSDIRHQTSDIRHSDGGGSGGTGLGLCICRQLMREAGGEISVTTQSGEGSTFRVKLLVTSC